MAITSTNYTDLSYILEVTPGTTPATPALQLLPTIGGAPMANISTVISETIRSDRQTDDLILTDQDTGGDVNFELTFDAWKPLMIALLQSSTPVAGDQWRNGADTPNSYTFLKRVVNAGTTTYFYYTGCQIAAMTFNIEVGGLITGSMSLIGYDENDTATEIVGSTYTPIAAYKLMSTAASVTTATITGATAQFSSLTLNVNNNINQAKKVGTLGAFDLASFTLEVGGDISIYFEDLTAYTLFKNSTSFALDLQLTDGDNNIIDINLPKCKFNSLEPPIEGKDNFLMLEGNFTALRDDSNDYMIEFDFTTGA